MDPITLSLIIVVGLLLALAVFVGIYYVVKSILSKNNTPVNPTVDDGAKEGATNDAEEGAKPAATIDALADRVVGNAISAALNALKEQETDKPLAATNDDKQDILGHHQRLNGPYNVPAEANHSLVAVAGSPRPQIVANVDGLPLTMEAVNGGSAYTFVLNDQAVIIDRDILFHNAQRNTAHQNLMLLRDVFSRAQSVALTNQASNEDAIPVENRLALTAAPAEEGSERPAPQEVGVPLLGMFNWASRALWPYSSLTSRLHNASDQERRVANRQIVHPPFYDMRDDSIHNLAEYTRGRGVLPF